MEEQKDEKPKEPATPQETSGGSSAKGKDRDRTKGFQTKKRVSMRRAAMKKR